MLFKWFRNINLIESLNQTIETYRLKSTNLEVEIERLESEVCKLDSYRLKFEVLKMYIDNDDDLIDLMDLAALKEESIRAFAKRKGIDDISDRRMSQLMHNDKY